jgi:hypothetical protein
MMRATIALAYVAACAGPDVAPPAAPPLPPPAPAATAPIDARLPDGPAVDAAASPEVWLRGNTHVHAKPSGDSREPIPSVIAWYEQHGYDFIALTDHNRVSEVDAGTTRGQAWVRAPASGLIVLSGIELTHNPGDCVPKGDDKCRIHVNGIGVTGRPDAKLEWAERRSNLRLDMYSAAIVATRALGGSLVQINHPNWHWGMTPDVMIEVARRGARLVEIANSQFESWNAGDQDHPSVETLWDAALAKGVELWGVASDDAHDYAADGSGKYPAGGGWIMVKAHRDPQAILDALGAGRFYASTGVTLARAEADADELVVEVAPGTSNTYTISFIENGKVVATVNGPSGRRQVPRTGYVRAVVTRDDGKKAWVQPVRRN